MWIEIVGWLGMGMLLGAFALASIKRMRDDRYTFHVFNLLGAIGVGLNAFSKGAMPSATVEVIWGGLAILGLAKVWHRSPNDVG